MSRPAPTYKEFEQQYLRRLEVSFSEAFKNGQKLSDKKVFSIIKNSFKELLSDVNQAFEPHHSPRTRHLADRQNLQSANQASPVKLKKASWANFDLADNNVQPAVENIAKELEAQRLAQSNKLKNKKDLKNKPSLTPKFKMENTKKLENAFKKVAKQVLSATMKPRPF